MQADILPPNPDPFATDWLTLATGNAPLSAEDDTASSNDPLGFFQSPSTGSHIRSGTETNVSSDDGTYSSGMTDYSWLQAADSRSTSDSAGPGSSSAPSYADQNASPFAASEMSFSGGCYTSASDFSSMFEPMSPFSSGSLFGSNIAAVQPDFTGDFDASALQALFTSPVGAGGSGLGSRRLPASASALAGVPLQAVSPASTSHLSPQVVTLPQLPVSSSLAPLDGGAVSSLGHSPPFAPTTSTSEPSLAHADSAQRLAPSASQTGQQRPFSSLAATAGIVLPPMPGVELAAAPGTHLENARSQPARASVADAVAAQPTRSTGRGRPAQSGAGKGPAVAPNPVGMIANAGLRQDVHESAPFQLLGNANFYSETQPPPRAASVSSASGRARRAKVSAEMDEQEDANKSAGRKGRKKAEGGHNAVEQKYRNSINSALAALRDNIPALSHLKPLPSMPTTKRKASQFSLASAAIPETPEGLIDGIPAARTLSKGVILNKAVEYIDFLRYSRSAQNEDLDLLKQMVREMVGEGSRLVDEFERRQTERHDDREVERKRLLAEDEQIDGVSGEDEEDEEDAPAPVAPSKGRAVSGGMKRGRPPTSTPASKKARASTRTKPPTRNDQYEHASDAQTMQHDPLAMQYQQDGSGHPAVHAFPPSPVSSEDRGLSPYAQVPYGQSGQGGRVALASFMGASFAGGIGFDLASTAAFAEESFAQAAGRAWTGGLLRRSVPDAEAARLPSHVSRLHPSLLSGLVALGAACLLVGLYTALRYVTSSRSRGGIPPARTKRGRALAALSVIAARPTTTYGAARKNALDARRALLGLTGGPNTILLPAAIAKEALIWVIRRITGLTWGCDGVTDEQATIEEAMAWIRIAEIEATVGWKIPYLTRAHTFLRLSNLSRAPTWPYVSPSTSRPAVDALISLHLLSLGHSGGAEATWSRMVKRRKKSDATGDSFVNIAVAADFDDVRERMGPATRNRKDFGEPASPSDTIPLLYMAEGACEAALEDVWANIVIAVARSTTSQHASRDAVATLPDISGDVEAIGRIAVEGSELYTLVAMTEIFLAILIHGSSSNAGAVSAALSHARTRLARLVLETKAGGPFSRLFCASPFFQLLAPTLSSSAESLAAILPAQAVLEPTSKIDLFAATLFSWLVCRRSAFAMSVDTSDAVKADRGLHARALAARHLLGHPRFRSRSDESRENELDEVDEAFEEARDALVDALTVVSRRAAGLRTAIDEDSGVELDSC